MQTLTESACLKTSLALAWLWRVGGGKAGLGKGLSILNDLEISHPGRTKLSTC